MDCQQQFSSPFLDLRAGDRGSNYLVSRPYWELDYGCRRTLARLRYLLGDRASICL